MHRDVRPLKEGYCDRCDEKLYRDEEVSPAMAAARIKWSKGKMDSILDYYRQQERGALIEWNIRTANSPLWIAYVLAKYFAPHVVQINSIRPPRVGPMEMLPEQAELQLGV
jgi:hypothetical protein